MGEERTIHEVVGVIEDIRELDVVVTELQSIGVNRAEIAILDDRKLRERLNSRRYEDDVNAPRTFFISKASFGDMEGALIGLGMLLACIPIFIAADWTIVTDGSMFLRVIPAAFVGGIIGFLVAAPVIRRYDEHLQTLIKQGGIVLWVNANSKDKEKRILDLLHRHSATDVHTHDLSWSS